MKKIISKFALLFSRKQKLIRNFYSLTVEEIEALHFDELAEYMNVMAWKAYHTSRRYGYIPSKTNQHYWASVLFTTLSVKAKSLVNVLPRLSNPNHHTNWDFPSVAGIVRSIIETRLLFYYFCIDNISEEERKLRHNILNIHDCDRRIKMFELENPESEELEDMRNTKRDLQNIVKNNSFFKQITDQKSSGYKKSLLSGKNSMIKPLEEIAEQVNFPRTSYKLYHLLLSNQIHSLPISFYQLGRFNRGRGVHNDCDEHYLRKCILISLTMLDGAINEMENLFENN